MLEKLMHLASKQEVQETSAEQSEMKERLMLVIDQYSKALPIMVRPLLPNLLGGLDEKMTDEHILLFVEKTQGLLNFIVTGEQDGEEFGNDQE